MIFYPSTWEKTLFVIGTLDSSFFGWLLVYLGCIGADFCTKTIITTVFTPYENSWQIRSKSRGCSVKSKHGQFVCYGFKLHERCRCTQTLNTHGERISERDVPVRSMSRRLLWSPWRFLNQNKLTGNFKFLTSDNRYKT